MNAPIDANHHKGLIVADVLDGEPLAVTGEEDNGAVSLHIKATNLMVTETHDYVAATYPSATSEVYTFKRGGSGGTTVATITIIYTDATKDNLSSAAKT